MDKVVLAILILITGGAVMSLILSRLVRRKWVWYVPSVIGVLVIVYLTLKIQSENMEGYEELGYVIQSLMVIAVMIGNILANVIIDLRRRKTTVT